MIREKFSGLEIEQSQAREQLIRGKESIDNVFNSIKDEKELEKRLRNNGIE
ncbi:MAG: hypothetical protein ABIE43_03160 [Patescibacteria group bacterium]